MKKTTEIGMNKTGMQMSPLSSQEMLNGTGNMIVPTHNHDAVRQAAESIRLEYIKEADPVGTVPVPGTVKGAVTTGTQMVTGTNPIPFLDKLGERLGFERTGVRLYDALIEKCRTLAPGADLTKLRQIRAEEAQHFAMLRECVIKLGAVQQL